MNKTYVFLKLLLFFCSLSYGQQNYDSLVVQFEKYILVSVNSLQEELEQDDYLSDYQKELVINYKIDILKAESFWDYQVEGSSQTLKMQFANIYQLKYYDMLLNKYYKLLIDKFNEQDKVILRQSQLNWIKFRDSEYNVNGLFRNIDYSGGGSIVILEITAKDINITQTRLQEIYEYLLRFYK